MPTTTDGRETDLESVRAETRKTNAEAEEIERRLRKGFFYSDVFMRLAALVAGAIAVYLFLGGEYQRRLDFEVDMAHREARVLKVAADNQTEENRRDSLVASAFRDSLISANGQLAAAADALQEQILQMQSQLNLATDQLAAEQSRVDISEATTRGLRTTIERLQHQDEAARLLGRKVDSLRTEVSGYPKFFRMTDVLPIGVKPDGE